MNEYLLFLPVKYRNRQGHDIEYHMDPHNRRKNRLLVNGYSFAKDTMKKGWIYWRCHGYRRSGFVQNILINWFWFD